MLRYLTLVLLSLPWLAGMAAAGAWPRDKGQVFLATAGQVEGPDQFGLYRQSFTLYAEYGAMERLTLGLDVGGDALRMTKAIAFARWPIGRAERALKIAYEMGVGEVEEETALRPGLSLGRGFTLWGRHGWAAFDGRAVLFGGGQAALESDITFGLSTTSHSKAMLQVQTGRSTFGRTYSRLAPSVVLETKPGIHLEFGVIAPLSGGGENGVKLGLWRQF